MVPKRVGSELRQRRVLVGLTQTAIANALGVTRAYISGVENGIDWDPDADKLVVWSRQLGWEDDRILRMLNRTAVPIETGPKLTASQLAEVQAAVTEGVREGVAQALRELLEKSGSVRGHES